MFIEKLEHVILLTLDSHGVSVGTVRFGLKGTFYNYSCLLLLPLAIVLLQLTKGK